jgi:hypothetical protein
MAAYMTIDWRSPRGRDLGQPARRNRVVAYEDWLMQLAAATAIVPRRQHGQSDGTSAASAVRPFARAAGRGIWV